MRECTEDCRANRLRAMLAVFAKYRPLPDLPRDEVQSAVKGHVFSSEYGRNDGAMDDGSERGGGYPHPGVSIEPLTVDAPRSICARSPAENLPAKGVNVIDLELYRQAQARMIKARTPAPKSPLDQLLDLIAELPEPARTLAYDALEAHYGRAV